MGRRFYVSLGSQGDRPQFADLVDVLTIPVIGVVRTLGTGCDAVGPEQRHALTTGMANAAIDQSIGVTLAQRAGELLTRTIVVRIVFGLIPHAQIVQPAIDRRYVATHLHGGGALPGTRQKAFAMKDRFADGGLDGLP